MLSHANSERARWSSPSRKLSAVDPVRGRPEAEQWRGNLLLVDLRMALVPVLHLKAHAQQADRLVTKNRPAETR